MEAAMKLARQYFLELPTPEPDRINFIARKHSYHGNFNPRDRPTSTNLLPR